MTEVKETQGHRKLKQYLEDLRRNKHFITALKRIEAALASRKEEKRDEKQESIMNDLIEEYRVINEEVNKALIKNETIVNKISHYLAEEYGIDGELAQSLEVSEILGKEDFYLGDIFDFCMIYDDYDENFNPVFPRVPFEFDTNRQLRIKAFPISIAIHKFATKRDILDFVEKRWDIIESFIETYRNKKYRFRKRKHDRKMTDLVWENRNSTAKEIKKLLDKQFPNNGLAYHEISKIISIEKRRRSRKIV